MRRLVFGLILLGMAVTAHAAASEYSEFFRDRDLPSIQIMQFNTDGLDRTKPSRLTLSIVPIRSADNALFGAGFSGTSRLHPVVEHQKEIAWATNPNWAQFFDSEHTSAVPLLRLETKGERLEIRPRRHSLSIQWRKELF